MWAAKAPKLSKHQKKKQRKAAKAALSVSGNLPKAAA